MDRSNVLTLIASVKRQNENGEFITEETPRDVFCNVRSVNRSEWHDAGQMGMNPQWVVTMFAPDYNGEEICVLHGARYSVYRTYFGKNDMLDLYLEMKAGTK